MAQNPLLHALSREKLLGMYEAMLRIRLFEEKVHFLFLEGVMPGTIHQCTGQEASAVGVCHALEKSDVIAGNHRSHGHSLAKGMDSYSCMAELLGKPDGCCRGKGGSMHFADAALGVYPATAVIGESILLATGAGLAFKMRGEKRVAAAFFGDGGSNIGSFHEGVNMGAIWNLPVLYVCENNQYAASTPWRDMLPVDKISIRSVGYGIPGETVDGMDVLAVYEAATRAVERARGGEGPTLLELVVYRFGGHSRTDPAAYRSRDEVKAWKEKDAIKKLGGQLVEAGIAPKDELGAIRAGVEKEIDDAYEKGKNAPEPDPRIALEDVI